MNTTRFVIIEDGQAMDGEIYEEAKLLRVLKYCDRDARVFAFDLAEAYSDGATSFRDVTEDMVVKAILARELDEEQPDRIGLPPRKLAKVA